MYNIVVVTVIGIVEFCSPRRRCEKSPGQENKSNEEKNESLELYAVDEHNSMKEITSNGPTTGQISHEERLKGRSANLLAATRTFRSSDADELQEARACRLQQLANVLRCL